VKAFVYRVIDELLPLSRGIYGADLGRNPRDVGLAHEAFRPNLPSLARLKKGFDPHNVLAHTCPLPEATVPKLILLITGKSGVGKDHCAAVWLSVLTDAGHLASVASISDATKREYVTVVGADLQLLLHVRAYKE